MGHQGKGNWPPPAWWVAPAWIEDRGAWDVACNEIADTLRLRLPKYRGWPCPPGGGGGYRLPTA